MGVDNSTRTDTHTDANDKPSREENPSTPPPDNPGSPGQPSRLESLARAREEQRAGVNGQTDSKTAETAPRQERTGTAESDRDTEREPDEGKTEQPSIRDSDNRSPAEDAGSPGRPSRLESLARAREEQRANALQRPEAPSGERTAQVGPQEKPEAAEGADEQPDAREFGAPPDTERRTDALGASGQEEAGDRGTGTDQPRDEPQHPAEEPSNSDSDRPPQPTDTGAPPPEQSPRDDDRPEREQAHASTEPTEGTAPAPASDGDRPAIDDDASSSEETNRGHEEPELQRDRAADQRHVGEPDEENDQPAQNSDESGEEGQRGREVAPHETTTTEVEEPSRFRGRVSISVDSDGRPIPPRRDTESETPDRGELRRPEDDPASRDYQAGDPERRSRRREFLRNFVTSADSTRDSADKFAEPAQKKLERIEPTGQHCGARPSYDQIRSNDQPLKTGSVMLGGVGMAIVLTEAFRYGFSVVRRIRGSENAGNR